MNSKYYSENICMVFLLQVFQIINFLLEIKKLEHSISQFFYLSFQMLLNPNNPSKNYIPSFQSIDFRLTENFLSSQNPSLEEYNEYQPGSLTYTETETGENNSLKFIDYPEYDKQNFDNIQIALNTKKGRLFEGLKNPQNEDKMKDPKMKKKRSILVVNKIQLNVNSTTDRSEGDTKRSNNPVSFNRIQRRCSFSRNKSNSISTHPPCNDKKNSNISQSIVVVSNSSHCTQNSDPPSQIRKRSISLMKTQDKSTISSIVRTLSRPRLQRSASERNSCNKEIKKSRVTTLTDRYSSRNINERKSVKENMMESKIRQLKKNFLQDPIPLQTIINVKSIKLQENTDMSRLYMRKIIQNRVSIQHYVQNKRAQHLFRH